MHILMYIYMDEDIEIKQYGTHDSQLQLNSAFTRLVGLAAVAQQWRMGGYMHALNKLSNKGVLTLNTRCSYHGHCKL